MVPWIRFRGLGATEGPQKLRSFLDYLSFQEGLSNSYTIKSLSDNYFRKKKTDFIIFMKNCGPQHTLGGSDDDNDPPWLRACVITLYYHRGVHWLCQELAFELDMWKMSYIYLKPVHFQARHIYTIKVADFAILWAPIKKCMSFDRQWFSIVTISTGG